jgi:glucosylceramidase
MIGMLINKIYMVAGVSFLLAGLHFEAASQSKTKVHCTVRQIDLDANKKVPVITIYKPTAQKQQTNSSVTIEVQLNPRQEMDGIGGAFNELGWDALSALPEKTRREVLHNLFDTQKGAALRFNRIPIGASDFAKSAYSLADSTNDWALNFFSIKRDESCLIPYIKAAQAFNPQMKFHASPWSPPGWMKSNGKQTGGGELLPDERILRSHASYLVKFLQAYQAHKININRLCPQNEPLVSGSYPGCKIPAALYAKAVKDFIIPAVEASGLSTEVWAGTFNYWRADTRSHFDDLVNENEMVDKVKGFSFQYTNMKWLKEFNRKFPGKPLQFSESECYNGENSKEEVLRDFQDFAAYTRAGTKLFTFWNMVLPEPHKSTWGWMQNSLVVIDTVKQSVIYQPSYALAKMIGSQVEPGDHYLPAQITKGDTLIGALHYKPKDAVNFMETDLENGEQLVAFAKKSGKIVILLYNHGDEVQANIVLNNRTVQATLPAQKLIALELDKIKF